MCKFDRSVCVSERKRKDNSSGITPRKTEVCVFSHTKGRVNSACKRVSAADTRVGTVDKRVGAVDKRVGAVDKRAQR